MDRLAVASDAAKASIAEVNDKEKKRKLCDDEEFERVYQESRYDKIQKVRDDCVNRHSDLWRQDSH